MTTDVQDKGRHVKDVSAEQSTPVISLEQVQIRLGKQIIQENINLSVQSGEFVTILGPNGAGKSTLLKLLLGLIKPSAGKIQVLGKLPHRGNTDIGYAPQHRTLEADLALRARDVVGFGLDGHRWGPGWPNRKRNAIIEQALEEVDALHFANAPVGQLSGGEQQRLLIAQALLTNPRLLLLDEPLSNLDITRGQEIVALVNHVCRARNVAVLLVAHDINPLLNVVDKVIYVANKRSTIGTPDEVITTESLTRLYGSPVEVVKALGRMFVVGAEI
ncbi:metal ABC transporter ATP-binding protein [Dictyobacter arantiisoli]|uniref:ABC transporter ATP-binding protein n=1 Tax=Dictyobacter arantiisoli TaxID=2014874 RepID=A0A5A5TCR0_9CHLR|nr:ATP-binding cassette domain-containing protein [Dictyobacter arantiisoli]GCF08724.1 ABC transporter ATP-binding protein [Dictyobacter arantiisoli]